MIKMLNDIATNTKVLYNQFRASLSLLYLAYQLIDENEFARYKTGSQTPISGKEVKKQIKRFVNQMVEYSEYKDDYLMENYRIEEE